MMNSLSLHFSVYPSQERHGVPFVSKVAAVLVSSDQMSGDVLFIWWLRRTHFGKEGLLLILFLKTSTMGKGEEVSLQAWAMDFCLGGVSGAFAKTLTAPIERVKLVIQTQDANPQIRSGEVPRYTGIGNFFPGFMLSRECPHFGEAISPTASGISQPRPSIFLSRTVSRSCSPGTMPRPSLVHFLP